MAKDWIEELANGIRSDARTAAEAFGRQQHRTGIIQARGHEFFVVFTTCLEENIAEIKRALQGDITSSETTTTRVSPREIKISRSRFPWFDAACRLEDNAIALDYIKGLGVAGDPAIANAGERIVRYFPFHVDEADALSVQPSFDDNGAPTHSPEELARQVTAILFQMKPATATV